MKIHSFSLHMLVLGALVGCAPSQRPKAEQAQSHDPRQPQFEHDEHETGPAPSHQGEEATSEPHGHRQGGHRFVDPDKLVAAWNDPERDAWQKPEEIVAALALDEGSTVVDLGAGTGYLLPFLTRAVGAEGEVIAADLEPAMLRFLDNAAKREGWSKVRTHLTTPSSVELPAESVEAMVTLNVWHHIEEREAYAQHLMQVLQPGGRLVVVDFLAEETEGFGPPLSMRLEAAQVAKELEAGGFEVEIVPETMPRHYVVRAIRPTSSGLRSGQ